MELLRAKQEREQDDDDEVDSDSEVGGEQNMENKGEGEGEGGDGKCNIVTNSRSRETAVSFIIMNEIRRKTMILPQNYR